MVTLFVLFASVYIACLILKLVFRITFRLLKWIVLAALSIAGYVLAAAFAVPLMIVIPGALILFLLVLVGGNKT